jgi:glycosyltransferase involved in cell wall biosynthesis
MKLCFLAGANSIHSKKWVQYFADKGHEVHWISLTPNECGSSENLKFYQMKRIPFLPADFLFCLIQVRMLIKKINPDILHAHYAKLNGAVAALTGFHPFVLTAWGSDVLIAPKSIIKRPFIKISVRKADLLTCDAEHVKEAMIKLGAEASKIHIIRFGIDTKRFSPGKTDEEIKNKLGASNAIVISLRSLEPVYDVETLIKSIPLIIKEIPETKFIIAGRGVQEEYLKELAKNLGVSKNIRFVGFLQNEEILKYLQISDVYVSTALSDAGLASSTAEAMACQLPVIITDSGENRKWIRSGENGFIVPVKNPQMLAEKIIYLLRNKDAREKFGNAGRKIIEKRDDYYREMEKMEGLYLAFRK